MRTSIFKHIFLPALVLLHLLLMFSCSNTRYLADDEKLYTGAKVKLSSEEVEKKELDKQEDKLSNAIRPRPNKRLFKSFRLRLWFYNIAGTPTGKGLRYLLKERWGEEPVLLSDVNSERNKAVLNNRLENSGYFDAVIEKESKEKKQRVRHIYHIELKRPYTISELKYPEGSEAIEKAINKHKLASLIEIGKAFDLEVLKAERERIARALTDEGFYYFSDEHIYFRADTNLSTKQAKLELRVRSDAPQQALMPWRVLSVYVHTELDNESSEHSQDTLWYKGIAFTGNTGFLSHKVLNQLLYVRPGFEYKRSLHEQSLSRINALNVYTFANIRFRQVNTASDTGLLNMHVQLVPADKRELSFEFRLVSKSNDFAGPGLSAALTNKNLNRGAEKLSFSLNSSFETQVSGSERNSYSYEAGFELSLEMPRFSGLAGRLRTAPNTLPQSRTTFSARLLERVNLYQLNAFRISHGYRWMAPKGFIHTLNPVNVNYLRLARADAELEARFERNPFLRRSFEEQFIPGASYSLFTQDLFRNHDELDYLIFLNAEISGHLLQLANASFSGESAPYKIFGLPYAQFSRVEIDNRFYKSIGSAKLIYRLIAGAGIPYGNSEVLPYVKQFFAGGANSIRAFHPRSIGPGTYLREGEESSYIDGQMGEIKLESSLEYRFPIAGIFKGALFTDAGNVWLYKENESLEGGKFDANSFYKDTYMGSGIGLRIDPGFFIIRFDLAMPIYRADRAESERWQLADINPSESSWRRENLVLNIAIGYPF